MTCHRPPHAWFAAPRLVVEVLSPSTEKEDRTTKLDFYESIPSMEAVLLVWQQDRRVRLRERAEDGWHDHDVIGLRHGAAGRPRDRPYPRRDSYHDPWARAGDEAEAR